MLSVRLVASILSGEVLTITILSTCLIAVILLAIPSISWLGDQLELGLSDWLTEELGLKLADAEDDGDRERDSEELGLNERDSLAEGD